MSVTYHIRIKKDYAVALIEDLEKMDAVELLMEESDEGFEIPEWQRKSVMARLEEAKRAPESLISWKAANQKLEKLL